jgi:hypothetical protein
MYTRLNQYDSLNIPEFSTLLWDNVKTTTIYSGVILAPIAAFLSIPFSIAAKETRIFKSNIEIQSAIDFISSYTDQQDQKYIIEQILKRDNASSCGLRSVESAWLKHRLAGNDVLTDKWQALKEYLNEKSNSGAHVHNGKKFFNTIVGIA